MHLLKMKNGEDLTVKAEGRIDTNTAITFGTEVNDELDDVKNLILDFEKVEYVSSLGLRAILEIQKRMNSQGSMKILNVSDAVMAVLKMTGFDKILIIE